MSHISAESVTAFMRITECKAPDDAIICITFDNDPRKAVPIANEGGSFVQLGQLRELAAAFGCWL